VLLYLLYAIGIVSPKNIERNENIQKRLKSANTKLEGTLYELNEHKVIVNDELKIASQKTIILANKISEKINEMLNLKKRLQ